MTDHVVLAVDGAAPSLAAERWVVERSHRIAAEIEVTSVLEHAPLAAGFPDAERDRRRRRLDEVAARLRAALPDAAVRAELRHGRVVDELIAASASASVLVVGMTRVDTVDEVGHLPLGLRLAGRTHGVLVVVPTGFGAAGGSDVVVGWDTDAAGEAALAFAAREARHTASVLNIVRARAGELPLDLELAAARLRASHPGLEVRVVHAVPPVASALLEAGRDASLIVVGSHGRNPLEDLLVGSVSEHVLARSPIPVAVVPEPSEPIAVSPEIVDEDL